MARYSGKNRVSDETRAEAAKLARGTQAPGQTKAQTRLIEQGIERGIDLYKKQQKEKARALDRQAREQRRRAGADHDPQTAPAPEQIAQPPPRPGPRRQWLPWLLLGLTWAGIAAQWVLRNAGP